MLTVPAIEKERYFSIQLIDAYTFNFDYIGTRTTGNDGGSFLIAGPGWKGEMPKGVKKVIRSETELLLAGYRTQLFNPADLENVKKIQAGYKAEPLSAFLGQAAPKAAPAIDFIKPLTPEQQRESLEFFNILNFVLQFCPTNPSETELMARFAKIGVGAGQTLDLGKLSPELKKAIEQGMADAWVEFASLKKRMDAGEVTAGELFGTREYLKNNYLYRMAAAVHGHLRQFEAGSDVSAVRSRFRRSQAGRCQPLRLALCTGPIAARQCVLVADDVRDASELARSQSAQPLPAQLADAAAVQTRCRWWHHSLRPERVARCGQGTELAACSQGSLHRFHAALLAEARGPRRHLETAADAAGSIAPSRPGIEG